MRKAGFSNALLDALTKAQRSALPPAAAVVSPTQQAVPAAPQQTQVDPCVAWEQEYARLHHEDDAINQACEQIGKSRPTDSVFADHCEAMNCSVHKRLMDLPNPNKCPANLETFGNQIDTCKDVDGYSPDPNLKYNLVQTLQPNDSKYSCAQLKVLTSVLAEDVSQIDKSLGNLSGKAQALNNDAQTNSNLAQMASAVGGKGAPVNAAALSMLSSSDIQAAGNVQQQAGSLQQIRDSQQKRHDYLMQIYFQRHCDD